MATMAIAAIMSNLRASKREFFRKENIFNPPNPTEALGALAPNLN
jgi:hypothetical protein